MNRRNLQKFVGCALSAIVILGNVGTVTDFCYAQEVKNSNEETDALITFYSNSDKKVDEEYKYCIQSGKNTQIINKISEIEDAEVEKVFEDIAISKGNEEVVDVVENLEEVYVEPNILVNGCSDSAEYYEEVQWYIDALNIDFEQDSDEQIKVELLDSGVAENSKIENVHRVDLISDEECNVLYDDTNSHGTAMAGIICADGSDGEFIGINSGIDLYSVKVLDSNLQASISTVVEGIYWGIENDVDVINMSFGTTYNSEILYNAISAASDAGIILVAAAGNDSSQGVLYPAAYEEVISVGATDSQGDIVAAYANGERVDIYAPGVQIVSTSAFDGYVCESGTSFACAEITAIVSRLLSIDGISDENIKDLLVYSGKHIESETGSGILADYGYAVEIAEEFLRDGQEESGLEVVNNTPVETYDTDNLVAGMWNTKTHKWLVENATSSATSLNATYLTCMLYAAQKSDSFKSIYVSTYNGSTDDYGGLHGLGCYTANLKALWKFANYTNQGQSISAAKASALASLSAEELALHGQAETNSLKNTTSGMLDTAGCFLTWVQSDSSNSGLAATSAYRKYLVVGLCIHQIGDIYAHRTLVPAYAFENAVESCPDESYASDNSSDFASYLVKDSFGEWNVLYTDFQSGKDIPFTSLSNEKYDPKFGNEKYEDNQAFCRERLNAASKVCRDFFARVSSSSNNIPTPTIIIEQTNVELIHSDIYITYYTG